MGAVKNFWFTDDQLEIFGHIKAIRNSKKDSSVFKFLLDCGYEKIFGDNPDKLSLKKELKAINKESSELKQDLSELKQGLSEFREEHKKMLKYLHTIAESLSIMNKRINSNS